MSEGSGAPLERILVGLDGSEGSAKALRWAIALAKAAGAEILAVHAYEVPVPVDPPLGVPVDMAVQELEVGRQLRDAVERAFRTEWTAVLDHAGVRYRRLLEEGPPGDVLLAVAERERPGLLVTGRRGRRSVVALLAGSVSQHLINRSPIPVAVVPAAGDRDEGAARTG